MNSYKLKSRFITFKKVLDFICLRRLCSPSISCSYMSRQNTTNRSRQNADYAVYRPCRLSTFLSYTCLHLHLWFAFIGSRYKIVFNISESLLFITKPEVIGSLHRRFPTQFFYASIESKVTYCASAAGG